MKKHTKIIYSHDEQKRKEICQECHKFKSIKCSLTKCLGEYRSIINSKLGKCPIGKF